ncbi:hypothetical protein [Actinomarinicola tropica]|uniref:Uncharacterized protein n=1 Tax=Actinomarinicola tropica TaxID=2789776 RepID=A0A5Q2RNS7_9ACTN|nr:hypothetical protein [Actinomarinicola tropica]QGG96241.1 hypothetical protein GH723_14650 [Actinomarinicola tropica]
MPAVPPADAPDFATLYASTPLAPRMAARLWDVAGLILDELRDDDMAEMWIDELPIVARPYLDDRFIAAFASRFEVLAGRLARGLNELTGLASCTADEIALHLVIDRTEELHEEAGLDWEWVDALPIHPADDDYVGIKDLLFRDLDVMFLYEPAFDGVDDPESETYRTQGFAHLHPRDWFKTLM